MSGCKEACVGTWILDTATWASNTKISSRLRPNMTVLFINSTRERVIKYWPGEREPPSIT